MRSIKFMALLIFVFATGNLFSQRGNHGKGHGHHPRGHHAHPKKVVVHRHSHYRPNKVMVYRPHWRPAYAYNRRWVFFPRHNMYWDNWRNHYVFYNGGVWISQPAPPAGVNDRDLEKEKSRELKEEEDDIDDVYKSNDDHKKDSTSTSEKK